MGSLGKLNLQTACLRNSFFAGSRVLVDLEVDVLVKFCVVPRSLTCQDFVDLRYDVFSAIDSIDWCVRNPQHTVHVWTSSVLKLNSVPEISQVPEWAHRRFQESVEEVVNTVVEMTCSSNRIRTDQSTY